MDIATTPSTPDGNPEMADAAREPKAPLLIRREDYVHEQSRKLIDGLFGGRIAPFITHFSERQDLSRDEIEELKRLIERLDHDR